RYYDETARLVSIRALSSASGAIANSYTYDPYGQVPASSGSAYNPFGYAGEYTDAETGFLYLRARYYDPATQQFLTVDPWLAATSSLYFPIIPSACFNKRGRSSRTALVSARVFSPGGPGAGRGVSRWSLPSATGSGG